jgi:hypothetical protein
VSAYNHRKSPCKNNVCLKTMTPEKVLEIMKDRLEAL